MVETSPQSPARCAYRVSVLGPFHLYRDGVLLETGHWQRPALNLLKLLAIAVDKRRSRDDLIDVLWRESEPQAGSSNLRYTVHRLRRDLGGAGADMPSPLLLEGGWVALNPAYRWEVDAARFEELARSEDIATLEEAAALYRGEPLAENRYDEWAALPRERLVRAWREACLRLARLYRGASHLDHTVRWLECALDGDPLDEEVLRALLDALDAAGRPAEAVRRYRRFEQHLREELDVPPGRETRALITHLRGHLTENAAADHDPVSTPIPTAERRPIALTPRYPLPISGRFVGREAESQAVMAAALPVRPPTSPGFVLLAAEAGMGKTRLLAEVAPRVREAGALVLAGGCYEQEGGLPYGPLHDALLDYVRAQPHAMLQARFGDLLPEIARIVPELRAVAPVTPEAHGDAESWRLRLFSAIARTLERIADEDPLVVLLDDLHWADAATLQVLHFILRQAGLARVCVVGAYRTDEVVRDDALDRFLQDVATVGRTQHLRLGSLSAASLAVVLADQMGDRCQRDLVQGIDERSGGNPFFALQMLRLLQEEGQLTYGPDGWRLVAGATITAPPAVQETVTRRLRHLTTDEREALTLGAVLGREFSYAVVEALWQGSERALFEALDAARVAHVVGETEGGYAFQHPVLWEVVYRRTPAPRRTLLHERAALALERLYGDEVDEHAAELAYHLVAAGRVHLDRAIRYLTVAGDQAERAFAHMEAERHYRKAVDYIRQAGDDTLLATVLEKLGGILKTLTRSAEALDVLEEAARIYAAVGDAAAEGRVVAQIGWVHYFAGRYAEGLARLQPVVAKLEAAGVSRGLAVLYGPLPRLLGMVSGPAAEITAAERAGNLARAVGDTGLLAGAEMRRGRGLQRMNRLEEAREVLGRASGLAEEAEDLFVLTAACLYAATVSYHLGQIDRAMRDSERAVVVAERRGGLEQLTSGVAQTCIHFAVVGGAWVRARAHLERFLSSVRSQVDPAMVAWYLLLYGMLSFYEGAWEQATRYLEESSTISRASGDLAQLRQAQALLAEKDLYERDPGTALNRLRPLVPAAWGEDDTGFQLSLAWAHLEMGHVAEAEALVGEALQQTMRHRQPTYRVDALRIHGMILARQGRWDEMGRVLEEAATLAQPMPYPYGEARVLYEHGRLLAQKGELLAQERLKDALAIFERLGAQPYVGWTRQALGGCR